MIKKVSVLLLTFFSVCAATPAAKPFNDIDLCNLKMSDTIRYKCTDGICSNAKGKYKYNYEKKQLIGVDYVNSSDYFSTVGIDPKLKLDLLHKKIVKINGFKQANIFDEPEEGFEYIQIDNFKNCSSTKAFYLFITKNEAGKAVLSVSTTPMI